MAVNSNKLEGFRVACEYIRDFCRLAQDRLGERAPGTKAAFEELEIMSSGMIDAPPAQLLPKLQ